ncbi:MAG TPA: FliI/YscN family ATPase [Nevskiaceae bacterium]|nr:FliI/YscN family ATPase [Nevskiaceae bacterium]
MISLPARPPALRQALEAARDRLAGVESVRGEGRLTRVVGLTLEAAGIQAPIGGRCRIESQPHPIEAEVVGFSGERLFLMPTGELSGLRPQARVLAGLGEARLPHGPALLGRVIDGEGRPLDGRGALPLHTPPSRAPLNPLQRAPIREVLDTGVRAINGLLTLGRGQRVGLFAGTGVGKSTLLGMLARYTRADVIVVGLIGERGREVRDFIDHNLGPEGLARACVVAAPADRPPLQRLAAARLATRIAEGFRDEGRHVLLLLDSLSRYAQAAREIGLAIGEPPATRGYPPSVFARLPALVERAGNAAEGGGSITALYTVLTEGDDLQDPIADAARGILDGHIVLSRQVAETGLYPAIDIEASLSRLAHELSPPAQREQARRLRQAASLYQRNRDLVAIGAYVRGSDPRVDAALAAWPRIEAYLRQEVDQRISHDQALRELAEVLPPGGSPA